MRPLLLAAAAAPAVAVPLDASAPEPAPVRRQLQDQVCNGMMAEMSPIVASCCGSNMEYCQGPVPSQCDPGCVPGAPPTPQSPGPSGPLRLISSTARLLFLR